MKYKFTFVILHYKTMDDTVKCINSIIEYIKNVKYDIVVVDNFSNDGSFESLNNMYKDNIRIKLIKNNENLGFARGNNVGYMYAKHNLESDFIILLNNDTYMIQNEFCKIIEDEYRISSFSVLGPKIYTPYKNSGRCNPMKLDQITIKELNNYILKFNLYKVLNLINLDSYYISFKEIIKTKLSYLKNSKYNIDYNRRMTNVQLQGCCLIFSPMYIRYFEGLDSRTFLYMEEDLLFIEMMKQNKLMVYNPNLKIFHSEEVTSNFISGNSRIQRKRKYKNLLTSIKIVRNTLMNN